MTTFVAGFQLMLALILVIGPQNAFVLRQGLRREHLPAVVAFCAVSDAALMALGVAGLGVASDMVPWLQTAMRWGGAAFLVWYAARSFRSALAGTGALTPAGGGPAPLGAVIGTLAVVTLANPHVWLDTVVLFGSVAAQHRSGSGGDGSGGGAEWVFWAGASTASLVFFATLGFGARALAPVFARPLAWRVLDAAVGAMMLVVAIGLILGAGL